MNLEEILSSELPEEISHRIVKRYCEVVDEYGKWDWNGFGAAVGKFVETVRRAIEYKVYGTYTPYDKSLVAFNSSELAKLESFNASANISWRIIIPRALYFIYCLRSKRGSLHESDINPGFIDASTMIRVAKWSVCEIVRLCADMDHIDKAEGYIRLIREPETELIWKSNYSGIMRVMSSSMPYADQVVVLLFYNDNRLSAEELLKCTGYKNKARFKSELLPELHKKRLIEFDGIMCELTGLGIDYACKIIAGNNERNDK